MDEDIRKGILDLFDRTINDIKSTDEGAQMYLIRMGIEPTLENVLSYLTARAIEFPLHQRARQVIRFDHDLHLPSPPVPVLKYD